MFTTLISLLLQTETAGAGATSGANANPQGGYQGLIMIVVLIAVFYFFMIRPQQKKAKKLRQEREAMKIGDAVVTAGGIHGKIVGIQDKENVFVISVGENVRIKVEKTSVYPSAVDIEQKN